MPRKEKKHDVLHMNLYMRKLILGDAENNFAAACKVNAVVCKEDFSQTMKFSMDIHRVKSKKKSLIP